MTGLAKYGFEVMVRYLGPPGDYHSPYAVVYETQVAPSDVSRTWTRTLYPDKWTGGCQSGDYEVDVNSLDGNRPAFGISRYLRCDFR